MVGMEKNVASIVPRSCSRVNHLSSIHASFDAILAAGIFYCLGPGLGRAGLGQDGSWWGGVKGREGRGAKYNGYVAFYLVSSFQRKLFVALRP